MTKEFYDKVAKKFGGYAYGSKNLDITREYPDDDPEVVFKQKLIVLGRDKRALDVGCGDCKFAFEIAEKFTEIIGIDTSKELLKIAQEKNEELQVKNVSFLLQNANRTNLDNESFDIIFCRRGPTYFKEYLRLLKDGGYYLEIGIGKKDSQALKEIFGRGQGFGKWNDEITQLQKYTEEMENVGFKTIFKKDYFYNEYYKSFEDLDIFLQGVPIFEDYGRKNDIEHLEKYVSKFQTDKGINLPRHRIVFIGQK